MHARSKQRSQTAEVRFCASPRCTAFLTLTPSSQCYDLCLVPSACLLCDLILFRHCDSLVHLAFACCLLLACSSLVCSGSDTDQESYSCSKAVWSAETGIEMPRDNLEAWTGQKCKIFWPDDADWYDAVVRLYDRSSGKHNVWYPFDHQVSHPSCSYCLWCVMQRLVCKTASWQLIMPQSKSTAYPGWSSNM